MKKKAINKIILLILIIAVVYFLFFKSNYYFLNGGKIIFETIDESSFNPIEKIDFYVKDHNIYISSISGLKKQTVSGEVVWTKTYNIKEPLLVTKDEYIAIVNLAGKEVFVFNTGGLISEFKVNYPIISAKINKNGFVAITQENNNQNIIELYNQEGKLLIRRVTNFENDGYPLDLELSDDALKMITSYVYMGRNTMETRISFYDFSDISQTEKVIGGHSLEGMFAPEIKMLPHSKLLVASTNGLHFFAYNSIPKYEKGIDLELDIKDLKITNKDIVVKQSTSSNEDENIISVFDFNGKKRGEHIVKNEILSLTAHEDSYYIVTKENVVKYKGTRRQWENSTKKEVKDIMKIDKNRYLFVYQNGYEILRVKRL